MFSHFLGGSDGAAPQLTAGIAQQRSAILHHPRTSNLMLNPLVQARVKTLQKQAEFLGMGSSRSRDNSLHPLEEDDSEHGDDDTRNKVKSIELRRAKFRINSPMASPAPSPRTSAQLAQEEPTPPASSNPSTVPSSSSNSPELPTVKKVVAIIETPATVNTVPAELVQPSLNGLHLVPSAEASTAKYRAQSLVPIVTRRPSDQAHDIASYSRDSHSDGKSIMLAALKPKPNVRHTIWGGGVLSPAAERHVEAAPPPPPEPVEDPEAHPMHSFPTDNPHVAMVLATRFLGTSPFVSRFHQSNAIMLAKELESRVFFSEDSIARVHSWRPREGDVIVCGVPRSGQTPVLRALNALRKNEAPSAEFTKAQRLALARAVIWVENDATQLPTSPITHGHAAPKLFSSKIGARAKASGPASDASVPGRLIKTHMTLQAALHGEPCPRGHRPMYKAVVVLRDPADLRVSWFRHLRRLYRHFHPDDASGFDFAIKLDDLAQAPTPRTASIIEEQFPENFIAEALKALFSPQICIVFYEELLIDARSVVERLARFTGWNVNNQELIDQIVSALEDDEQSHPKWGRRRGASGSAIKYFSPASQRFIEDRWDYIVRMRFSAYPTYAELYSSLTSQPYPLPVAIKSKTPHSSGVPPSPRGSGLSRLLSKKSSAQSLRSVEEPLVVDPDDDSEAVMTLGSRRARRPSILGGGRLRGNSDLELSLN